MFFDITKPNSFEIDELEDIRPQHQLTDEVAKRHDECVQLDVCFAFYKQYDGCGCGHFDKKIPNDGLIKHLHAKEEPIDIKQRRQNKYRLNQNNRTAFCGTKQIACIEKISQKQRERFSRSS